MEEKVKTIFSIFAIIGVMSTIGFISSLFDKEAEVDIDYICDEYITKISSLEEEKQDLKDEQAIYEIEIEELKQQLEICNEELDDCSYDSEAYKNYDWPKLTE